MAIRLLSLESGRCIAGAGWSSFLGTDRVARFESIIRPFGIRGACKVETLVAFGNWGSRFSPKAQAITAVCDDWVVVVVVVVVVLKSHV